MSTFKNLSKNFDANNLLLQHMQLSEICKEKSVINEEGLS